MRLIRDFIGIVFLTTAVNLFPADNWLETTAIILCLTAAIKLLQE